MATTIWSAEALKSMRYSGYKDTSYAVAELIDNCFDAAAKNVKIIFVSKRTGGQVPKIVEILICDDGCGMDKAVLDAALRFGSGTSQNMDQDIAIQRRRKGKFGFGLPNASISQCQVVTLYSWQKKGKILTTKLDLPECIKHDNVYLPDPSEIELPKDLVEFGAVCDEDHGTIVSWKECDMLSHSTAAGEIPHLERRLGRLFRHLIKNDQATISFHHFIRNGEHIENGTPEDNFIKPLDPLFLIENTVASKDIWEAAHSNNPKIADAYKHFSISESEHRATSHRADDWSYDQEFSWAGRVYKFTFTTSFVDIKIQKPGLRNGGDVGIGKLYGRLFNADGNISFVRADREIQSGTFEIYKNKYAPEHRFWAIEVKFDQDVDDLIGVSNNKQGIQFKATERDTALDALPQEDGDIAGGKAALFRWLTGHLQGIQKLVFAKVKQQGRDWDNTHDQVNPNPSIPIQRPETTDVTGIVDQIRAHGLSEEALTALKTNLIRKYPTISHEDIQVVVNQFDLSRQKSVIVYAPFDQSSLWSSTLFQGFLLITVNTNNPFYENFIEPLREKNQITELTAFELLIHASAFSEDVLSAGENETMLFEHYRTFIGTKLEAYLSRLQATSKEDDAE